MTQDQVLLSLGFTQCTDGTLVAPTDTVVSFTPSFAPVIGRCFEIKISINGSSVCAVVNGRALRFCREAKP